MNKESKRTRLFCVLGIFIKNPMAFIYPKAHNTSLPKPENASVDALQA